MEINHDTWTLWKSVEKGRLVRARLHLLEVRISPLDGSFHRPMTREEFFAAFTSADLDVRIAKVTALRLPCNPKEDAARNGLLEGAQTGARQKCGPRKGLLHQPIRQEPTELEKDKA